MLTPTSVVWAYIRVSGDEQADRGLPVAGQRRAIEEYAQDHNLHLSRIFIDEARSGGSDQREQFQLMMRLAHEDPPPCSAILLWSWSRFARDQDDAHYWKASLRRHGVQIIALDGVPPEIAGGIEYILEAAIHWKDEQKLQEISHNARRGQQTLAKLGYVPSGCSPPRGYKVEFEEREIEGRVRRLRRWVPDPAIWALVNQAWQMRLQGRSYKDIWREAGLYKTPYCFNTFFSNAIYKGELWFGGTLIQVPGVVTPQEWAQVNNDRGKRRSGAYPRRQGSRFLLSGLLQCARCGSALAGDFGWSGRRSDGYKRVQWDCYICLKKKRGQCDLRRAKARTLEDMVINALFGDILSEENLNRQWAKIEAERETERPALMARRDSLAERIRRATIGISKLLDAIEFQPDTRSLARRLAQREAERERLREESAEIEARLSGQPPPVEDIQRNRNNLREAIQTGPPQLARSALRTFIARIIVDDDELRIRYKLPFAPTGIRSVPPRASLLYPGRRLAGNLNQSRG